MEQKSLQLHAPKDYTSQEENYSALPHYIWCCELKPCKSYKAEWKTLYPTDSWEINQSCVIAVNVEEIEPIFPFFQLTDLVNWSLLPVFLSVFPNSS